MAERKSPYLAYAKHPISLTDRLAIDRTILANERTLLAYIRSALTFLVVGGTLLKFFSAVSAMIMGYVAIAVAGILFTTGIRRYHVMKRHLTPAGAYLPPNDIS
jgi:putative membrane protein